MGRVFGGVLGVFWGTQVKGDSVFPDRLKLVIFKKKQNSVNENLRTLIHSIRRVFQQQSP